MLQKNFLIMTLCVLLILVANFGLNILLRVSLGAVSILLFIDVINQIRRLYNERENKN